MSYFSQAEFDAWVSQSSHTDASLSMISPQQLDASFTDVSFIFHTLESHGLFTSLSAEQLAGLSIPHITTLFTITTDNSYNTTDYIYDASHDYITGDQLLHFNENQIQAIPANTIARSIFSDSDFSQHKLQFLSPSQLVKLTTAQVKARFGDFTPTQKQALAPAKLSTLTATQVFASIEVFTLTQMQSFVVGQLTSLTPSDVANAITWPKFSSAQVKLFIPSQLANLTSLQISSQLTFFNPIQVQYLMSVTATHAASQFATTDISGLLHDALNGGFLASQISTLTPTEVNTNWSHFSNSQIKTFTDHQLSTLSHANITSKHQVFTASQVRGLWGLTDGVSSPEFKFLTTDISGLDIIGQLIALEPLQIAGDMTSHSNVSSMTELQLQSLTITSPDQLAALTASQVATGVTSDAVAKIILDALLPAQVRSLTDGTNGTNQLAALTAAQVATYFPSAAADYAVSSNKYFTPSQIRQLGYGANGSVDQLSALNAQQVAAAVNSTGALYFTLDQIRSLTSNGDNITDTTSANQVALLTAEQLGTNISQFTAAQVAHRISSFTTADIVRLSDGVNFSTYNQLAALSAQQIATEINASGNSIFSDFTPSQVSQLTYYDAQTIYDEVTGPTPFQISALFAAQVAERWGDFSPAQIPSFTALQLTQLTASQIQSITDVHVFSIFNGLTVKQVHRLTYGNDSDIHQLTSLNAYQIAAKIQYFSAPQIASFSADQLANLTAAQIATTRTIADPTDNVNGSAICVFDALSNAQLPMLTNGVDGFVNQLAALSASQVASRWSNGTGTWFTSEQIPVFKQSQLHEMSQSILDPTWTATIANPLYLPPFGGYPPEFIEDEFFGSIPNPDYAGPYPSPTIPNSPQPYTTSVELGLSATQVKGQWQYFTPHQIAGFSDDQTSLVRAHEAQVAATALAAANALAAQVAAAAIPAATYIAMPMSTFIEQLSSVIGLLPAATLAAIAEAKPEYIANMTSDQIAALSGDQIVAISQYLTQPQVAGFTPGDLALGNGVVINNNIHNVFADDAKTIPFLSTSNKHYAGISQAQIMSISYQTTATTTNSVTGLPILYPNYYSVSHLSASFIAYLTADAFGGFTNPNAGALATFTQLQALHIAEAQYNTLDESEKLVIHDILLYNIAPINFDLAGLNSQADTPLFIADIMYAPKLGAYSAEVIVHMETAAAKEFLQYAFSTSFDPAGFDIATSEGETRLYLDKTKFAVAVIRGSSLTPLSEGVSPQEYKSYDFSMNTNAYVPDQNINWNGNVRSSSLSSDPNISMSVDMIHYIADQTFNSYAMYGLFNDQVNQNILLEKSINGAINATIRPILQTYDIHTSNDSVLQMLFPPEDIEDHPIKFMDSSNNTAGSGPNVVTYYSKLDRSIDANGINANGIASNTAEAKNLPSCVFDIMFKAQPQRFKMQTHTYQRDLATGNYPMPFIDGDRLRFLCTCNTDPNQNTLAVPAPDATPSDQPGAQVKSRTYLITIVLGDAVACGCPENE